MANHEQLDVPDNITPIFLPSRALELNPVENVWQYPARTGFQTRFSKTTTPSSTCLHRMAKAHRSTRNDHVHRDARLSSRRSAAMTSGMTRRLLGILSIQPNQIALQDEI